MTLSRFLLAATMLTAASPAFAQSASEMSLRINRLEEQVRQLTGKNEEYQFQIRQLQNQLQQAGATPAAPGRPEAPPPSAASAPQVGPPPGTRPAPQLGAADPNGNLAPRDPGTMPSGPTSGPVTGSPGPLNSSEPGAPMVIAPDFAAPGPAGGPPAGAPPAGRPNTSIATATPTGSPEEEYALGAGFLQRKDYEFAQTQFEGFLKQFPNDARAPDALYGLGESFHQRGQHSDAIEPYLEVVTKHPQSPRAADSMLRLGQTLGAIDQKEQACATLLEIGNKYPRSNARTQSVREMQKLGC